MTNEEMHSTMQFLLEQQAQFSARQQKDAERIARVENAVLILTELARRADERMDTSDASLKAANDTFNEKMNRLAEAQAETEQRLNALINIVERYLTGHNGGSQA